MLADAEAHSVPVNQLLLRATTQLHDKNKKFLKYRTEGIVAPDDLCIIAINCGDMRGFEALDAGYISNAFYPTRCKNWGEEWWTWAAPYQIPKESGGIIQASVFAGANFDSITGVIFSTDSISALLKSETDFRYFPNPRNYYSLPPKWIPWYEETIVKGSEADLVMETIRNCETIATVSGLFPSFDPQ